MGLNSLEIKRRIVIEERSSKRKELFRGKLF